MRRFVAMARVSSREQQREGFSLDVHEDALCKYAERREGEITRLFRVAETASKRDERKTFRELIEFVQKNAARLDGLLVYKLDRAARNLPDYVLLETLEDECGVPFIVYSQPTENTPTGRLNRRCKRHLPLSRRSSKDRTCGKVWNGAPAKAGSLAKPHTAIEMCVSMDEASLRRTRGTGQRSNASSPSMQIMVTLLARSEKHCSSKECSSSHQNRSLVGAVCTKC